ncbi:MAG: hypothetical protein IPI58_09875 [Alphaproteobacteria bacterium]|nr:MAG: hypothetical protein IPI58_09875 [Alphaproteobacteria bacterium]
MQDLHSDTSLVQIIGPAGMTSDNIPAAIDLQGYDAAEILLGIAAGGITFDATNKIEFKLTHSDDNSSYVDVTTADMNGVTVTGTGIIKALTSAHASPAAYRFGYKGGKRYLKLLADFSGTHGTGTPICAMLLRGHAAIQPQANQA